MLRPSLLGSHVFLPMGISFNLNKKKRDNKTFSVYDFNWFNAVYLPEVLLPFWIRASEHCRTIRWVILMILFCTLVSLWTKMYLLGCKWEREMVVSGKLVSSLSSSLVSLSSPGPGVISLTSLSSHSPSPSSPSLLSSPAAGGRVVQRRLDVTHSCRPTNPVFVTHQLLPLLVQKLSGPRSDLLDVFLDRLHLPLTSVAKHAVLVDLRGDKPELYWPARDKNTRARVCYLKEESKAHDQVRRWQIVFLSWKEADQAWQTLHLKLYQI